MKEIRKGLKVKLSLNNKKGTIVHVARAKNIRGDSFVVSFTIKFITNQIQTYSPRDWGKQIILDE